MKKTYAIKCIDRQKYFVAFHSYTPFFSKEKGKAKRFSSEQEAIDYGLQELFDNRAAFEVEETIWHKIS